MKYKILNTAREAIYLQVYHQIRQDIIEHVLPQGTRLPSKRFLAEELGISVITVEHAYQLLMDEGYIESRPRSGFYVSFGGPRQAVSAGHVIRQEPITQAPEDFPFSIWARTVRTVLSEYDRRVLARSPNRGCQELKKALAAYMIRSRGMDVDPDQIVIGSGAEYLYGLVVQLLGRDRGYALEDPSYEKIRKVYEAYGAACEMLEMGADGILSYELQDCTAGVLHVTPFHSYPSGVTASAAKRREYAAWASRRDAVIVEDDYDAEFASPTRQVETIYSLAPAHVIYINTFTKILAPSMRTGFMVLPERLLPVYQEKLDFYSCTVPVLDQLVLAEFIEQGHLERYINRRRRKMRRSEK